LVQRVECCVGDSNAPILRDVEVARIDANLDNVRFERNHFGVRVLAQHGRCQHSQDAKLAAVQIGERSETIAGRYVLGTGFMGLGVILVSDQNFARLFPYRSLEQVNLGPIQLKPGVDPDRAAAELRKGLGPDTQIFTRSELEAHEVAYWTTRTSVGLIFGSGLIISFVVGIMVVYQTLATQVSRQLPQFATLKAIGYRDRSLDGTVVTISLLIVLVAFVPALAAALGIYSVIRDETLLPVAMTSPRLAAVFVATLVMASISALLSLGSLRRADPAELF